MSENFYIMACTVLPVLLIGSMLTFADAARQVGEGDKTLRVLKIVLYGQLVLAFTAFSFSLGLLSAWTPSTGHMEPSEYEIWFNLAAYYVSFSLLVSLSVNVVLAGLAAVGWAGELPDRGSASLHKGNDSGSP